MRWAKSTAAASILVTLFAGIISNQATAAPPAVAKAVPDNGDIGVDPNLKEIRITFDQPMGEGFNTIRTRYQRRRLCVSQVCARIVLTLTKDSLRPLFSSSLYR